MSWPRGPLLANAPFQVLSCKYFLSYFSRGNKTRFKHELRPKENDTLFGVPQPFYTKILTNIGNNISHLSLLQDIFQNSHKQFQMVTSDLDPFFSGHKIRIHSFVRIPWGFPVTFFSLEILTCKSFKVSFIESAIMSLEQRGCVSRRSNFQYEISPKSNTPSSKKAKCLKTILRLLISWFVEG